MVFSRTSIISSVHPQGQVWNWIMKLKGKSNQICSVLCSLSFTTFHKPWKFYCPETSFKCIALHTLQLVRCLWDIGQLTSPEAPCTSQALLLLFYVQNYCLVLTNNPLIQGPFLLFCAINKEKKQISCPRSGSQNQGLSQQLGTKAAHGHLKAQCCSFAQSVEWTVV